MLDTIEVSIRAGCTDVPPFPAIKAEVAEIFGSAIGLVRFFPIDPSQWWDVGTWGEYEGLCHHSVVRVEGGLIVDT